MKKFNFIKSMKKSIKESIALFASVFIFAAIFFSLTKTDKTDRETARQIARINNVIATRDTVLQKDFLLDAEEMLRTADKGIEFEQAVERLRNRIDYLRSLPKDSFKIERKRIAPQLRSVTAR